MNEPCARGFAEWVHDAGSRRVKASGATNSFASGLHLDTTTSAGRILAPIELTTNEFEARRAVGRGVYPRARADTFTFGIGGTVTGGRRTTFRAARTPPAGTSARRRSVAACRRKFLAYFPGGFNDEVYLETERAYKWNAHLAWQSQLSKHLSGRDVASPQAVAMDAVRIESRTNLLFSFEKMAIRDATRDFSGARRFVLGLSTWLHGSGNESARFEDWCEELARLPRRQTRVLTWPVATVFGYIARPRTHIFLKPNVTRHAAQAYGFDLAYSSTPNWATYRSMLEFARQIRYDVRDLEPRDMIDIQSFIWVLGSDEYP